MDQRRFDAALRALNGGTTRRRGIAAAIGALAAGRIGGSALAGPEPGPDAAGACGTSPQQNTCRDGSDCCTGICRPTKNGKGRCRCVKVGKPCTSSKNCCSEGGDPMTCKGNRCLLV